MSKWGIKMRRYAVFISCEEYKEFDDIEGLTGNFMVALSTTFWGILFAIVFKGIDAVVSGPMERIVEDTNYVVRYEGKEEQE